MKKVVCVDFPKCKEMDPPPPDGTYAVVSHNPGYQKPTDLVPNPFPWRTAIYKFEDGSADKLGAGSSAGNMLILFEVDKVFLLGLSKGERAELDRNLAQEQIELVEEVAA